MKDKASSGRGSEDDALSTASTSKNHDSTSEYLEPEVDVETLVQGLKNGQLTPSQQ